MSLALPQSVLELTAAQRTSDTEWGGQVAIGAVIDGCRVFQLLAAHVAKRADAITRHRQITLERHAGQTKIGDVNVSLAVKQEVGRAIDLRNRGNGQTET